VSKDNSSTTSSGIGITGLLGVAFVVLKLTGYIDWSWWWVAAPFWLPIVLGLSFLVFYFVILLIFNNDKRR
jgi:phosphoglycerol transferase MdoB-like AlkP superfamily enzyme